MTHQSNRCLATYALTDGTPQFETHFALINVDEKSGLLCAFPSAEIRDLAIDAAFNLRRHAQAVKHADAFAMATHGAAMWFRQDDGEMVQLVLNRPRGVPALSVVRISDYG